MLSKEEIKRLRMLHTSSGRSESGLFLAEGEKVVHELMTSGLEVVKILVKPSLLKDFSHASAEIREITDAEMERVTQFHSASPVAAVAKIPERKKISGQRILFLDDIADPGNMGTLFRLADWFAVDTVLVSAGSVDTWNPKVVQASMGSVFRKNILNNQTSSVLPELKKHGFSIVGTHLGGADIGQWKPANKTVIVMGNESRGLHPEIAGMCDTLIRIPGRGEAESLNVAAAAAIVLYEMNKN